MDNSAGVVPRALCLQSFDLALGSVGWMLVVNIIIRSSSVLIQLMNWVRQRE
jgi:hypothetical protein